ncbi:GntR family transcriptional regulator [Streptomyces sp. x-80]|uniref:GntR family transcriptional regulator n=1 Tax=Streptomyces sp. x-80 TaxID=2789282 RepID=UPI00397EEEF2
MRRLGATGNSPVDAPDTPGRKLRRSGGEEEEMDVKAVSGAVSRGCCQPVLVAASEAGRPSDQVLADELLSGPVVLEELPAAGEIARLFRVPLVTAQFVWRSAVTRLRARGCLTAGGDRPGVRRPVREEAADDLRARLRAGQFPTRLPDRGSLAIRYGVSEDTVTKAARQLARERILQVPHGRRGTHIHPRLLVEGVPA